MGKEFQILNKDGTPPVAERFYALTADPSYWNIGVDITQPFAKMNAIIHSTNTEFATDHSEHIINSGSNILATADRALSRVPKNTKKKALILGTGNCIDIPLSQLARRFDEVTLVDVDTNSTEKAVENLELDHQRKIRIVAADIGGFLGSFSDGITRTLTVGPQGFLKNAEDVTDRTRVENASPQLGNDYTFVCSQLLMSQLAGLPFLFLQNTFESKYKKNFNSFRATNPRLFKYFQEKMVEAQREHIKYLSRCVRPEGTVHLADTYVRADRAEGLEDFEKKVMVHPYFVDPVIDRHFTRIAQEPNMWVWTNHPDNLSFLVVSHSLDPKQKTFS